MSLPEKVAISTSKLTALGDAVRSRFGVSGDLTLDEMAYDVENTPIPTPPLVPSEYQQVDYVESSGTQRIETGLFNDSLTNDRQVRYDGDLYMTSFDKWSNTHQYLGSQGGWFFGNGGNGSGSYVWYVGDKQFGSNAPCEADTWYDFSATIGCSANTNRGQYPESAIAYITKRNDGTSYALSWAGNGYWGVNQNYQICLFSLNGQNHPCKWRMSYCKIYINNKLERHFVPCYRKSDNEIGMYDIINGTFYTNAGTGSFTCYPAPQ